MFSILKKSIFLWGFFFWMFTVQNTFATRGFNEPMQREHFTGGTPHSTPQFKKTKGRVLRVYRGKVYFNKGSLHGIAKGDLIAVFSHKLIKTYDADHNKMMIKPSMKLNAVLQIVEVRKNNSMALLRKGDKAYKNDFFERTNEHVYRHFFFPQRVGNVWRFQSDTKIIVGVKAVSVGILSSNTLSYAFDIPLKIQIGVQPIAAVISADPSISSNLFGQISFDHSFFELGLGLGYQVGANGLSGLVLTGGFRVGSDDGLNMKVNSQWVLAGKSNTAGVAEGFTLGAITGEINFPLVSKVTLFFGGGYGSTEWAYGEVGVKTYLWGKGEPNTFMISAAVGGSGVYSKDKIQAIGPHASIGFDYRF